MLLVEVVSFWFVFIISFYVIGIMLIRFFFDKIGVVLVIIFMGYWVSF